MHSDTVSPRGERRVQQGLLSILEHFEFLEGTRLRDTFFGHYQAACHRSAGTCTITLPPFIPKTCIQVPPHATLVRLVATALAMDFETYSTQKAVSESEPLRLDGNLTQTMTLTCSFEGATELPVLLMLGLLFMEEYEGFCYPMREKQYNSMAIVQAEQGTDIQSEK